MGKFTKLDIVIVITLIALGLIPWPFTKSPYPLIGGWLPLPLLYYWILEAMYFTYICILVYRWLKR